MSKGSEKDSDGEEDRFRKSIKYALLGYLVLLAVSLIGYHYGFWIYSTRSHLLRVLIAGPIVLGMFYGLYRALTGLTRRKKFLVAVTFMVGFPLWLVFQTLLHIIYGLGSDTSAGIAIALAYPIGLIIAELWGRARDYRLGAIQ